MQSSVELGVLEKNGEGLLMSTGLLSEVMNVV